MEPASAKPPLKSRFLRRAKPATLRRSQTSVAALFFVCGFGFSNWLSRIPTVRVQLELSDRVLGLLLLCTGIGSIVSFSIAGGLIRRYSSRTVAVLGTSAFCVVLNAAPNSPSAWVAAGALLLLGFAAGFMDVAMNTQAVEVERQSTRPILSTLHGIFSLGGLAGAGTGALAASLEVSPALHMLLATAPLLLLTLWAGGGLLPATDMAPSQNMGRPHGVLLVLGAIGFCSSVGEGAMADWIGVYLHDDLHTTMGIAGIGFAGYSLAMVIGRFSCDVLTQRFAPRQLVRWAGLTVAVGLALGLVINEPWAIIAASMAVGLGLSPIIPVILRAGGSLPNISPSQALSTLATLSYSGFLFGPPSIGLVAEHVGLRVGLALVVALAFVLTALSEWMPGERRRTRVAT
jgi:fucose permease